MGVSDFASSFKLGNIDFSGLLNKVYAYAGIFILLVIVGGIIFAYFAIRSKKKNKGEKFHIGWWRDNGNRMERDHVIDVDEIVIPGTSLRIFHNSKKDIWIPRFTKTVGGKMYYVCLTSTNQMINFDIPSLDMELKRANVDYKDPTGALWAAENSREYIKRNYRDKSVPWWQLYQTTIATAAMIVIMAFSFILIIYFLRGIVVDLGVVANQLGEYTKQACQNAQTSGVAVIG